MDEIPGDTIESPTDCADKSQVERHSAPLRVDEPSFLTSAWRQVIPKENSDLDKIETGLFY